MIVLISMLLLWSSCDTIPGKENRSMGRDNRNKAYHFSTPGKIMVLPKVLHEISGITMLSDSSIACVQDEQGIVFIYDTKQAKLIREIPFHTKGDYEGIAQMGNSLFVLRSDGILFEIQHYQSAQFNIVMHATGIAAKDNEGLCADIVHNRLLIASKSKPGKDSIYKDRRFIHGYDPGSKELASQPVWIFDVSALQKWVASTNSPDTSEPAIKFRPSAIALHPVTGQLYLLSAQDHLLCIFDKQGKPEQFISLDSKIFTQPEGITFFKNGDLLIANEGKQAQPTLVYFSYKQ